MGSSESTPKKPEAQSQITDNSSGFHVFEIHVPTVSSGIGIIALILISAVILIYLIQRLKKKFTKPQRAAMQQQQQQGNMMHSLGLGLPMHHISNGSLEMGQIPGQGPMPQLLLQLQQLQQLQQLRLPRDHPPRAASPSRFEEVYEASREIQAAARRLGRSSIDVRNDPSCA